MKKTNKEPEIQENKTAPTADAQPAAKVKKLPSRTLLCLVILGVCLLAGDAAASLLNKWLGTSVFNWRIPFRMAAMVAFLSLVAEALHIFFRHWTPKAGRGGTAFSIANSAARYILGLAGLLWGLAILGVDVGALLAGAGVVALIIGFGAESLIADVITGIFMLFEHQYEVGDIIVVGNFRGTVTKIGIRTTSITDTGGNIQIINNSNISNLINRSNVNSFAVCDIAIPYYGYLRKAEALLTELLPRLYEENKTVFEAVPRYLGVQTLDLPNNAIVLRISAEVPERSIYSGQRLLNRALLLAFEDAGIPIPVPELKVDRE